MRNILWLFIISLMISGCLGEESFSLSPDDRVTFGVDSVEIDTVISGEGSVTYQFWAYNRNSKALRIKDLYLGKGGSSSFRVNVDGEFLADGRNGIPNELLAGDSCCIFVEVTPNEEHPQTVYRVEDELVLVTEGGARSAVKLAASCLNVKVLRGEVISDDITLQADRPYQILDSLVVAEGKTLTIPAGTQLLFHADASLVVYGTLRVEGSLEQPVIFRGDRLGMMFENQPYDRISSQWQGIEFRKGSTGNYLNYCDIHSGVYGVKCDEAELNIENSVIHNMRQYCLQSTMSTVWAGNCQITNAGEDCLNIKGGSLDFVHCTVANFYPFIDRSEQAATLRFSNGYDNRLLPLQKLLFCNCLITGFAKDCIYGDDISTTSSDAVPFEYFFQNCLLCTPRDESMLQLNTIWEDEQPEETRRAKNFLPEFDYDALIFSFTLNPASSAIGNGDPEVAKLYPLDRNGHPRTEQKTDIGCYQYQVLP